MFTVLLITIIIIIIVFFLQENIGLEKNSNFFKELVIKWNKKFIWFLSVVLALCLVSVSVMIYSGNSFLNTDHHIINREGIRFRDSLLFSSSTRPYNSFTGNSGSSVAVIKDSMGSVSLIVSNTSYPLMISKNDGETFRFANPDYNEFIDSSFTIIRNGSNDTLYHIGKGTLDSLRMRKKGKFFGIRKNKEHYVNHQIGLGRIRGSQKKNEYKYLLEGSKLVFSYVKPVNEKIDSANFQFFCGNVLRQNFNKYIIYIDGSRYIINPSGVPEKYKMSKGDEFFIFSDDRSINRRFKLLRDSVNVFMTYTLPYRYKLKGTLSGKNEILTLTNIEDTLIKPVNSNVIYEEFPFDTLPYKYSAQIAYKTDKGGRQLNVRKIHGCKEFKKIDALEYKEYFVTDSRPDYGVVFSVENMARSNRFNFLFIVIPLVLYFLIMWASMSMINKYKITNRSVAERYYNPVFQSVVFIIPVLFTVRWFLAWRAATFPPLDNSMTKNEILTLTDFFASGRIWTDYFFLFIFVILSVIFSYPGILSDKVKKLFKKIEKIKIFQSTLFTFILLLIPAIILSIFSVRFFVVFAPLYAICLIFLFIRNNDHWGKLPLWTRNFRILKSVYFQLIIFFVFLAGILLFFFLNKDKGFGILYLVSIILTVFPFMLYLLNKENNKLFPILKVALSVAAVLVFFLILGNGDRLTDRLITDLQVKSRVKVMYEDESTVFNSVVNDDAYYEKLIETFQYRSYINAYKEYGAGWLPSRFFGFDLQEHFTPDRNYDIQTYDTVGARYIYAEHGALAYWLIIIFLLIPIAVRAFHTFSDRNNPPVMHWSQNDKGFVATFFSNFDLFCLLLVFMIGLIIGMSNTNNFIFIGQDLPVVAFGSVLTIATVLLLYLFALANKRSDENYISLSQSAFDMFRTPAFRVILMFMVTLLIFISGLIMNGIMAENKKATASFNLENHINNLNSLLEKYNDGIWKFQYDSMQVHNDFVRSVDRNNLPDSILVEIIRKHKSEIKQANSADPLNDFLYKKFENLLNDRTRWFNRNELFSFVRREGLLKLKINGSFFKRAYPMAKTDDWKGHLTALSGRDTIYLAYNKWVNGSFRYVYPFKGRYSWVYDMIFDIKKSSVETGFPQKGQDFMLSVDFALQDTISNIITRGNLTGRSDPQHLEALVQFRDMPWNMKIDSNNYLSVWIRIDSSSITLIDDGGNIGNKLTDTINSKLNDREIRRSLKNGEYEKFEFLVVDVLNDVMYLHNPPVYVTVADASGKIRLLLDYNAIPGYDPNRSSMAGFYEKVGTFSKSYQIEEKMRQNGCMTVLKPGPGSSIKPVIYSSVLSQYNLNWEDLKVENRWVHAVEYGNIQYYGGKRLQNRMKWTSSIFESNTFSFPEGEMISSKEYLSKSSNLYHSAIIFLGHYKTARLRAIDSILINRRYDTTSFNFPKLLYRNSTKYFNRENWPSFTDTSSLLCRGLNRNYGFVISKNNKEAVSRQRFIIDIDSMNNRRLRNIELFSKRVAHTTAGGEPIETTALDMALNGVKLYSLNRNVLSGVRALSLAPFDIPSSKFIIDNSYSNYSEFVRTVAENIYIPMNNTLIDGTFRASVLNQIGLQTTINEARNKCKIEDKPIFIYAKTGTTFEKGRDFKFGDKALLFIFTDRDMSNIDSENDFENIKLYSVYIHHKNISETRSEVMKLRRQVIKAIYESQSFKTYFGIK